MINPLIITRKENAGLFRKVCHDLGATQRELVADEWSLSLFLKSDLKNYTFQSHYILDISAVKEKGDDFISLCEGITYQKDNANIIIYADQSYPGDSFLDKLVHCGFTNIVANYTDADEKTNITQMTEDLKECLTSGLSKQKWRRFDKSFDAFAEAREAAMIAEKEKEKPRYSQAELHIAVVGAQSRIGTTTLAIRLAEYFHSRDGESVVVCANKRGIPQLDMIKEFYDGMEQNGIYTVNGIDICSPYAEPTKTYNAEIYDFGSTPASDLDFKDFDKVYVVGGTSWNELPMIYTAQLALNKVNYTVAVNFSDEAAVERYREALAVNLNDVILLPFEPELFEIGQYEEIFDREFGETVKRDEISV
ncbi:MAG: hypothetical protein J6A19_16485 [Oscillospiraceae bacterium]|nr:hypothetical protein [Oscillospiraceae bacterium]